MKKVTLDITVCDYDLIVAAIPLGRSCWDGRRTSPTNQDSSTGRRHWRIHEGQSLSGTSSRTPNQMRMTKKTRTGKRRRRTRTKIPSQTKTNSCLDPSYRRVGFFKLSLCMVNTFTASRQQSICYFTEEANVGLVDRFAKTRRSH